MKPLIRIISFSVVLLLLPVGLYALFQSLLKKENPSFASKYDFIVKAEVPPTGEGEAACESAAAESCCQGEGEGK